ncbi:hypothetical protein G6M84_03150 [Agrobacterium tumefaciens]|uniref:nitroreductase family protein n=1 Tax=Agrobacterium tumefaciens TaxID=358 RepID=UPI001573842E|nr:nitroreductase [Agrobacterium tumefaciens]NTB95504.1 hypothetical protein [Agrobacterium tumefaciens]NTC47652.1 hypothetical protein [Agrobacterium tumefaciens]
MGLATKLNDGVHELVAPTMANRRSVPPALLHSPAPTDQELLEILTLASRVPDHGNLVPWRFILVRDDQSHALLEKFLHAHASEHKDEPSQSAMAARLRAWMIGPPATVFLVWHPTDEAPFPELDQLFCVGAVATTFLHAVHMKGFGSIWLTGWPCTSERVKQIMGLDPHERLIGLFPLGTPERRPAERARPNTSDLLSEWRS